MVSLTASPLFLAIYSLRRRLTNGQDMRKNYLVQSISGHRHDRLQEHAQKKDMFDRVRENSCFDENKER